jgi:PAS domain S-box-containing protein
MSKTNVKGIIEYVNDYFTEVCKYEEWELIGQPHNVIRHPDMPQIAFKILWNRLLKGKNMHAVVKNLAKDGSYYWVVTDFQHKYDDNGNIVALYSRRKAVPDKVRDYFSDLYAKLIEMEKIGGMQASGSYLQGFLEDNNTTYDKFLLSIFELTEKQLMSYMRAQISDAQLHGEDHLSAEQAIDKTTKKKRLFGRLFGN